MSRKCVLGIDETNHSIQLQWRLALGTWEMMGEDIGVWIEAHQRPL
jgi:hypothetical protein